MTNSEPLVSVVMSVNRDDGNLYDSINSILNQSYKNIEFLIVNDGSSKDVNQVLMKIKDKRIVFLQKNRKTASSEQRMDSWLLLVDCFSVFLFFHLVYGFRV